MTLVVSRQAGAPAATRDPWAQTALDLAAPATELVVTPARHPAPRPRLALFVLLSAATTAVFVAISTPRDSPLNYYLSVVWSMYLPLVVIGLVGLAHARVRTRSQMARSAFPGHTDRQLIVTVPSLLRSANLPALKRVLSSLLTYCPQSFRHFRVDVVSEEGCDVTALYDWLERLGPAGAHVRVVTVPAAYETPRRSRFKTRANHYAMELRRVLGENTAATYVYHLDDDTHVDADTIASLAEFIETSQGRYLLAQGTLAFPHELTPSRFCRLADSIRPADDLTRFAFFTGSLGTPLGGLHGEHVIIRADVEDEIGWDFPDTVIEDAYFAIEFSRRYPGRSTTLNSYSYGASPASIGDLVKQRRRWIEGLLRLAKNGRLPRSARIPLGYSILTWTCAPLQFVGLAVAVSYLAGFDNTSPVEPWLIPLWGVCLGYVFWEYIEGLRVNLAASKSRRHSLLYQLLIVPFVYVVSPVETYAVVLGIVRFLGLGRQRAPEVITKPV